MRKILFFGNSHLAALKLGWDTLPARPDWKVQFFGSHGGGVVGFKPGRDGALVPDSPRLSRKLQALWGFSEVRPDDFDIVCTVGLGGRAVTFAGAVRRNAALASPDELKAAARRSVSDSLAGQIVATLRQITSRPVIVIQTPAPSLDARESRYSSLNGISPDRAQALSDAMLWGLRKMDGVDDVLPQPEETKAGPLFTKPEYSRGSVTLAVTPEEHADDDHGHMNGAYGIKVLQALDRFVRH